MLHVVQVHVVINFSDIVKVIASVDNLLHNFYYFPEDVRIIKQPVSTPVMIGQKVELECRAEGVPRPKYMWFKGQTPLMDQRGPRLVIENV